MWSCWDEQTGETMARLLEALVIALVWADE
jgi:hypothetical protein